MTKLQELYSLNYTIGNLLLAVEANYLIRGKTNEKENNTRKKVNI